MKLNADDDNFAIKKDTIDKGLIDFDIIEFIEIVDKTEDRYKYRIIDVASKLDGDAIAWSNLNCHWTVYDGSDELVFVEVGGTIIAYDNNGDIVLPDVANS